MIEGKFGEFYWIEFSLQEFNIDDLLRGRPELILDKYLAVVCFDSGPMKLMETEKEKGWTENDKIAFSPKLTMEIIPEIFYEQHDQWCLFEFPTHFVEMTDFVNYIGFTLRDRRPELENIDPTWDKLGMEKQIEAHEELVQRFWNEMKTINPINFILEGEKFIFVTKHYHEIEVLKN